MARRKLRVLVTRCWGIGGGQVWAHEFSNRLAELGHDVQVIFIRSWWPGRGRQRKISDQEVSEPKYRASFVEAPLFFEGYWLTKSLRRCLEHEKRDVIVSTGAEGAWLNFGLRRRTLPHVATFHHPHAERVGLSRLIMRSGNLTRRGIARTYLRWSDYWDRISMSHADQVVCSSLHQAKRVGDVLRIAEQKVRVIYYGIDIHRFFPPPAEREPRRREFLYAGGPWPSKGVGVLLEAFARIHTKFPEVGISVVGGGNWTPYQEKIEAYGFSDRVRYYGQVPHEDMGEFYRSAYLLVAPTRHESFGLILAEAMACGLPVVATRVTAVPEVVEDGVTGLLVPADDVSSLAKGLETLLRDPSRAARMGCAGRARVEEQFAWEKIILQWEQLLLRAADGGLS